METKINEKEQSLEVSKVSNKFEVVNEKNKNGLDVLAIFGILVLIVSAIIIVITMAFFYVDKKNQKIYSGVYISEVNVSDLSKEEAVEKLQEYLQSNVPEEIKLKHEDYETTISTADLEINFDINSAVDVAYDMGRSGNFFQNEWNIIKMKLLNINIEPIFTLNEETLKKQLEDISTKLPNKIIQSDWYIDNNNLIITKGNAGEVVKVEDMVANIKNCIYNRALKDDVLEIITETQEPEKIDIESIHTEIYKEAKDAYYTQDPFTLYPSENGLDFNISVEDARAMLQEEKEEYIIPLKVLYPQVTTNMIGTEAFPDLLSTFSTKYAASNTNRTTNLILAANKINGTVVMPGEEFSYNRVVGARTIAAGYKEAAIYVEGRVENGLGGGICQITTTLYNAVVYANLEIVERRNHQFVPSYAGASRDATVVYGSTDFRFKNNRNYPIKLVCSVANGVANFQIFGLKTDNEYEVEISSRITRRTASYINSEAYKILKQNGQVVSTELLSKDTYKQH